MKTTVFDSTNLRAVHFAERIFDCVADEDIENGTFGYFEDLYDGYTHVYKFVKGCMDGKPVVVANNPAWSEDTCRRTNQRRDQYIIPAGTPFRAFALHEGDEFGLSIEGIVPGSETWLTTPTDFTTSPVYLTIDAGTGKLNASSSSNAGMYGSGVPMEARVVRKRTMGSTLVTGAHEYGHSNVMYEARITALA